MALTTAAATTASDVFARDVEQTWRFLRRRLGEDAEYLAFVEFTTGDGTRSGGHRRIHTHGLVKREGLDFAVLPELEAELSDFWCRRTGDADKRAVKRKGRAPAHRVELRELRTIAGATAYLTLHHHKKGQRPPPGWKGRRLRPSKNYWALPARELREHAQAFIQDRQRRAALRALLASEHLPDAEAYGEVFDQLLARAEAEPRARLVKTYDEPVEWDEHGIPTAYETRVSGPAHGDDVVDLDE